LNGGAKSTQAKGNINIENHVFEKYRPNQLQVIELRGKKRVGIDELSYDDFEANLIIINRKKIAVMSYGLGAAGVLVTMVDDVDWHNEFEQQIYKLKPQPKLSLF
jgi:hypothetical protein